MRYFPLVSTALIALSLTHPASAQTPTPPPAPMTAPVPPPALGTPPLPVLSVPTPPGGRLRVEMDARSEDVLGVLKSFLKGIGETNGTRRGASPARPAAPSPIADALEGGDLAEMLKDVNHIHFVVYEMPGAKPSTQTITFQSPIKKGKKLVAVTPAQPVVPTPPAAPKFDSNGFYEAAFASEGAHRIFFTDADEYKLVMVGFPDRKGYAFAVSGGGYVAVSRTDGYPNLEALTAFLSRATDAALRSQAMRKVLKDGVDPEPDPKPGKELGKIAP